MLRASFDLGVAARARMLQLVSQALPTGAFAYSGGLESAQELGFLRTEADCHEWFVPWMKVSLGYVELPYFVRILRALQVADESAARLQSACLFASREGAELQRQDRQMARSLHRVLAAICPESCPVGHISLTYSEALARAARYYQLTEDDALLCCAYGWLEQHVSALSRLIPLGPLAGQKLMDACLKLLPELIERGRNLPDRELGASCPGLARASAFHETQYTRIFRS